MNSHILFVLFFILSVLKPIDIPNINKYMGMGLFFLISIIFIYTLLKNQTWKKLWVNYRWEISLIGLFLLVNIISLIINLDRFINLQQLIFFAGGSFAVWLIFPMSWVIFKQHHSEKFSWFSLSLIAFIVLVAFLQVKFINFSNYITSYTVANDITPFEVEFEKNNIHLLKRNCLISPTNITLFIYPELKENILDKRKKYNSILVLRQLDNKNKCQINYELPEYPINRITLIEAKTGGLSSTWQKTYIQLSDHGYIEADNKKFITSVLRGSNPFAPIATITILMAIILIFKLGNKSFYNSIILLLSILVVLSLYTGIYSESRNFIFTLLIGCFCILIYFFKQYLKLIIFFSLAIIVCLHIFMIQNNFLNNYSKVFPYVSKFKENKPINIVDFIPKTHQLNTGREKIWAKGFALWKKSPIIGNGAGIYHAIAKTNEVANLNLHNYYLQVLIECGILGFLFLLIIILLLIYRSIQAKNTVLMLTILSALIFDNFMDYSIPWVLFMSWSLYYSSYRFIK